MLMIAGTETSKVTGFREITSPPKTSASESLSSCVSYSLANILRTGKSCTYCQMMFGPMMIAKTTIFHQNWCRISAVLVVLKKSNEDRPKIKNKASYLVRKPNTTVRVKHHRYL